MASERKFVLKALHDFDVKEFLGKELSSAGVSSIEIQKTPIATRITIAVRRPGLVVGKKGKTIKDISDVLKTIYGIDNPQIEVIEVQNPSLDAILMAEKIGRQLEVKGQAKSVMRFAVKEIMDAGAVGTEVRCAGKLVGKGGKAKNVAIRKGYLKKSGEEAKKVKVGTFTAYLKAGAIGVTVKIVLPGTQFSDHIDVSNLKLPTTQDGEQLPTNATEAAQENAASDKIQKAKEEKIKRVRAKKASDAPKEETKTEDATQATAEKPKRKPIIKKKTNDKEAEKGETQ